MTVRLTYISGKTPVAKELAQESAASAVVFSEDSHWLAVGNEAGIVRLWRLGPLDGVSPPLLLPDSTGKIVGLGFAGTDRLFTASNGSRDIRAWSTATGEEMLTLKADASVAELKILCDGRAVVAKTKAGWEAFYAPTMDEVERSEATGGW